MPAWFACHARIFHLLLPLPCGSGVMSDIRPAMAAPLAAHLEELYRTESPKLLRYFQRRVREGDDAFDLVQESFVRLTRFMARHPLPYPAPYLQRIARNLLFDRARRLDTRLAIFHVPVDDAGLAIDADQAHRMEADDVMRLYRSALEALPDKTREIFLLHRMDELTYKEIGKRLGLSIPTVQYHVARALDRIDAALGQE